MNTRLAGGALIIFTVLSAPATPAFARTVTDQTFLDCMDEQNSPPSNPKVAANTGYEMLPRPSYVWPSTLTMTGSSPFRFSVTEIKDKESKKLDLWWVLYRVAVRKDGTEVAAVVVDKRHEVALMHPSPKRISPFLPHDYSSYGEFLLAPVQNPPNNYFHLVFEIRDECAPVLGSRVPDYRPPTNSAYINSTYRGDTNMVFVLNTTQSNKLES